MAEYHRVYKEVEPGVWGWTSEAVSSGGIGSGCDYLTCEDSLADLRTVQITVVGQAEVDDSNAYVAVEDNLGNTRAAFEATLVGDDDAQAVLRAQSADGLSSSIVTVTANDGASPTFQLRAEEIHFDGGVPIVRPTFDLSSGTLPQLAQALADLGLIDVVP